MRAIAIDFQNAFLNATLSEDIYVYAPPGSEPLPMTWSISYRGLCMVSNRVLASGILPRTNFSLMNVVLRTYELNIART